MVITNLFDLLRMIFSVRDKQGHTFLVEKQRGQQKPKITKQETQVTWF
jgi:hypothetical protein